MAVRNRDTMLNEDVKLDMILVLSQALIFQILWPRKTQCCVQTSTAD